MRRMETGQPGRGASALQQTRQAADRLLDGPSRLVAAPCLMPASRAYAVPRLDGIPTEYQFAGGIDAAARLALTLISAGLADAAQWAQVRGDPIAFIARALKDFVEAHGGEELRTEFYIGLGPYRRNPRKNDKAVDRMVASIKEFGFKIPVLARSTGEVVDGHLRLKAARALQMNEVPVILCDEWTDAQVKAFRLLVNRSATWADWDLELVAIEIQELKGLNFDLNLTGFDRLEIDEFLFGEQFEGEDEAPELPATPVSRIGDLWLCGMHRVLCGDSTSADIVRRLLNSSTPRAMVTDPPYGVEYDPKWRERAGLGRQRQTGLVAHDDRVDWTAAYRLFPGDVAYVWHAGVHAGEVSAGLERAGFHIRAQIIWAKQHFALGRGDYHWQHEPCWYAVREGKDSNWSGDRTLLAGS